MERVHGWLGCRFRRVGGMINGRGLQEVGTEREIGKKDRIRWKG